MLKVTASLQSQIQTRKFIFNYIQNKTGTLPRRGQVGKTSHAIQTIHTIESAISEAPIREVFNVDVIMPNFSFAPIYRVVLRYSNWSDDKEVAKTVKQSVPVISYSAAKQVVANAKAYGNSIVITANQDDAKKYMKNLVAKGLDADIIEA